MDAALRAISEPQRRQILRLVAKKELPAGEIASHFAVSRPAISQHLRVLKDAGLIAERRDGTRRLYRTRFDTVAELRTFFEQMWDDGLARLKEVAELAQHEQDEREDPKND